MINLFKEKKSPKELGRILFVRCVSMTESFIKGMANYQQLCKNAATDEDINGQELLIAHMWVVVDLLQTDIRKDKKYYDAVGFMHNTYIDLLNIPQKEADEEIKYLAARYEEYRGIFRNQPEPDYRKVALCIAQNISKKPNIVANAFLHTQITLSLQNLIIHSGKSLEKIKLVD